MKTELNPENYENQYLDKLNECFPNWGSFDTLDWVINRSFEGHKPDFFVLKSDTDEILAGSAISYRKLKSKDNNSYQIGIMTGSWTLPISRGMGCFTETIHKSNEIVAAKNMDFLTAFVTESNASYRRLRDAGSLLVATNYIISEKISNQITNPNSRVEILEKTENNTQIIFDIRNKLMQSKLHFVYDFSDFKKQFINRTNPTFILKIDSEYAIIEETSKMFQLHFCTSYKFNIISEIVDWTNSKHKEIIFFSTDKNHEFQNNSDYKIVPGFFTVLDNEHSKSKNMNLIFGSEFDIQYGDKM
jgi:hypothetical protein